MARDSVCMCQLGIWKAEYPVLAGPLGRGIAETSNSNPARQSPLDGGFDQIGREERERDRHIDLADAAFFARSDLLDIGDGASNDLFEPATTTGDRCDKRGAGLGADRATVL